MFRIGITLIISFILSNQLFSQQRLDIKGGGTISGKVFDESTKKTVEFANVILFAQKDSMQITGAVTNKEGRFILKGIKPDKYYLYIQFIGYARKKIDKISISKSNLNLDLGNIYLKPTAITLQNVVVEGKRSPISYQLDKKVIDVSQMQTAISGTAADVLQNIPSVSVDIDGNVSLRGSTNFTVLINGRPSVMSAQDALQQIPASSIQNIELITNPSAKYDASGTAGIINIVLKKNSDLGLSGVVNIMGGLYDKYGSDFLFQYKTHSVSYDFGAYFNRRSFPGKNLQEKQFIIGDSTSYLNSTGNMLWQRIYSGVRGGIDFSLSDFDNLSLSGRYGSGQFHRNSILNYIQWTNTTPQQLHYLSNTTGNHYGTYYAVNANYQHKFGTNGHEITAEVFYHHNNSNEAALTSSTQNNIQINGTETTELGPESEIRGKLDYTLPITKLQKFSAGAEYFSRLRQNINALYNYDSTNNVYEFQPLFSNTNDFNRTRFAAYSMYADKWDSLAAQVGVRTEYTYQLVKLAETNEHYSLSRWDFFPSLHTSLNLAGGTQIMASYTRRIERPDGGDLEPFYTWFNANNVRIGNPNLRPELIDSYELGYQTFLGSASISNDFYYRFTHDKIEHINSVYAENVTLNSIANVGSDYSLGGEFMILFNPIKMWEFNLMGDIYDYRITGAISNESFSRESVNWSIKNNNVFKLAVETDLQINTRYFSPSVSAQGTWGGFFTTDLAVKHTLFEKKLSLTLQIGDLFRTGKREFTSQGVDFYNYNYFTRQSPTVMLNVRYTFNNYKDKKQVNQDQQDNGNSPD
ncbi:MAG: TonB-dependent receptor [Ignavibacteriaceae bacterium]